MIKIESYKDLAEHINKKRHLILSFSQKLLNEAGAIRVVNVEGGFKLESKGDLSFYENQLLLMVIDNLSRDQIKNVVGYVCYSFFYYKISSGAESITDDEYHAVKTIFDNGWKHAVISKEEIDAYNEKLEAYNALSGRVKLAFDLGEIEGVGIPVDPALKMKTLVFNNFEKIKPVDDLFLDGIDFNLNSDLVSINGEQGGFHEQGRFFSFDIEIKEHINDEFTAAKKYNGIQYRVHGIKTNGGYLNVFRALTSMPPSYHDL